MCEQIYVTKIDWDYEEKCETIYEEKCHGHGYDKHCSPVPKQNCHQVPVKVEKQVPKTKCKKVPEKKCSDVPKFIPRKECKDFPKKVCTKDPVQVPRNIQIKVCSAHPKEVCIKIPKEVLIQVPKQVTKKVCKSTKGGGYHEDVHDHHSGYGREANVDEASIETYDFDGIEDVEFSELHKPIGDEKALESILTPAWFEENNNWKKRLAEQEERDGRSAEDIWGIDSLILSERDVDKNLTIDNTADFMSHVIEDVASDKEFNISDLIEIMKDTEPRNKTGIGNKSIESMNNNISTFQVPNPNNSRSEKNPDVEEILADEKQKSEETNQSNFSRFGGFSPFGSQDPFPNWR